MLPLSLSKRIDSVTSSSKRFADNPDLESALAILSGSLGVRICTGDRLTAILRFAGQLVASAQAWSITQSPIGLMRPVS